MTAVAKEVIYCFSGTSAFRHCDPQKIGQELADLGIGTDECHRAREILDAARVKGTELHKAIFKDTVSEAAEAWRLELCRTLLRTISCDVSTGPKKVARPVYVHLTDAAGPRYVPVYRVANDAVLRDRALAEALRQLQGLQTRYAWISELHDVFAAATAAAKKAKKS